MKKKKSISLVLILMLVVALSSGCASTNSNNHKSISTPADLNSDGYKIGVPEGTSAMTAAEEYYDKAEIIYYNSLTDGYMALETKKIDAFIFDSHALSYVAETNNKLAILPNSLIAEENIVIGAPFGNEELVNQVNEFIAQYRTDGTYDDMFKRWFKNTSHVMPKIEKPENPTMKIVVATEGLNEPMNYYGDNGVLTGFDIEFINRLALFLNAEIEVETNNFPGLVAGVETGRYDLLVANLNKTPERVERMLMTDAYVDAEVCLLVHSDHVDVQASQQNSTDENSIPKYTSYDELNGKTICEMTGTIFFDFVDDVGIEYEQMYCNDLISQAEAVKTGKADAMLTDDPIARLLVAQVPELAIMPELLANDSYGIAVKKGSDLTPQINKVIEQFQNDGTMDEIAKKWLSSDESIKKLPELDFSNANGTIKYAYDSQNVPMAYVGDNGEALGYDVELVLRIAHALNMNVELIQMNFDALIPALQSGKADIASGCMSITEERMKTVDFTIPYYEGGVAIVVQATNVSTGSTGSLEEESFFAGIKDSFTSTFIKESRWKLIVEGIGTTLIISILSAIFGSVLGFGICIMKIAKNKVLSGIASIYIRLFQGTPIVVILMIFNYIVFATYNGNPIWIAVLSFGMNFAAYVSEMMRTGILAVDKGQTEAALAIGFSKSKTFFKIVFPQAARHFLPVFRGEFISLVKMTSVVGYIAIQDLTKMSDIIRSRTYDAFFPLIATAIIYFVLAYLLTIVITVVEKKINPLTRKRTLKGVEIK